MDTADKTPELVNREEARLRGLPQFFNGIPCKHGHLSRRSTETGQCRRCIADAMARLRERRRTTPRAIPEVSEGLISRAHAQTAHLSHYFTGVRCKNGHLALRTTKNKACVECHREQTAAARRADPVKERAVKAASYRRNRDSVLAKAKAYIEANSETVRARRKAFYHANKERLNAAYAEWAKANRPKLRVHEKRRRDRKRGAVGQHTLADVQDIGRMQRWLCANPVCHRKIRSGYHEDHIIPIARGGTDDRRNIQLLCAPCNQSKHARDPVAWMQSNGLLL